MRLAQHFALENSLIEADCVEATEFPDLAGRHRVFAVPKIVINDKTSFEGALPEQLFLDEVLKAVGAAEKPEDPQP